MPHVLQNRLDSKSLLKSPSRHQRPLHVEKRLRQGRRRQPPAIRPKPEAVQAGPPKCVRRERYVAAIPLDSERVHKIKLGRQTFRLY